MNNLFFELLQVALGTRERLSRVPSNAEWWTIFEETERQAVTGIMAGGLEQLPAEQLPSTPLKLQWIGMMQMVEASTRLNRVRSIELTETVSTLGFKSYILKGVAMARYYPQPLRRQCGDIDLWVFGHRKDVMTWLRSKYEITHNVWHNVGAVVFPDVPVEIHFHPGWLWNPWHNRRLQKWFDGYTFISHQSSAFGYNVMPAEFDAVYSLIHTFRHMIAEGVGLRHVVDYYYVLRKIQNSRDIINHTSEILHQLGMDKFTAAMMWVLRELFFPKGDCSSKMEDVCWMLCEPNEKEGRFLLDEIMAGGNFGHYHNQKPMRSSMRQLLIMLPHYTNEVIWVLPWKLWHRVWRCFHSF